MLPSRFFILSSLGLLLLPHMNVLAQTKGSTEKKIYCWDEGGKKVCGDALPASAVDSARSEINIKSGLTTNRISRALTDEERSQAMQAAELARKQAEAEAMQYRRDLSMVEAYMTEADLRRAYGERTSLLDEAIKTSRLSISNLRLSSLSLLRQASDQEIAGAPVTKRLTDSIREQHAELLRQEVILENQQTDRQLLERELEDALQRYRKMRGEENPPPSAPTPAP
jgi:hypothetical protein